MPTLFKSEREHLRHIYCATGRQLSCKKSLLVIWKSWRLFVNTMHAVDNSSLRNRDNLMQPIHMQLSQKLKTFSGFFKVFSKSIISHINYWEQVNSWKNLWKFWNGPLCRNKSGPSPLLNVAVYWQSSDTETFVTKLSQILANNIDNGGRGIGLRIYVRYCLKKLVKNKRGFGKTRQFFLAWTHYSWCWEHAKWF